MLIIRDDIQDIAQAEYDAIVASLPQWRQDVVATYRHIEDRRESALSFHILQQALAEEYSISNVRFIKNAHGKPSLKNHEDIHFSISHCRHAVACIISSRPVGVDIERLGRYKERIARYSLSDEELASLYYVKHDGMSQEESADLQFTILWTKKEALLKLIGTGITDDITQILHMYEGQVNFRTTINTEKRYVCTTAEWTL